MRCAKRTLALLFVAAVCGACTIGRPLDQLDPTTGPRGTQARVSYGQPRPETQILGELIAVRDDGLLLLSDARLILVRYNLIREATFSDTRGVGRLRRSGHERQRRALAGFSRYPFGLTADQLDRLLESLGQDRLTVVR